MIDESDLWAEALITLLVKNEQLVLSKRAADHLTGRVAAYFGRTTKPSAAALATVLVDHPAVDDLLADDDQLQAAIDASKPKGEVVPVSEPPPLKPRPTEVLPLDGFADDARRALVKAQALADAAHQEEVTPWHLLAAILETSAEIAKRRGGDPDKARESCRVQMLHGRATEPASIGGLLRQLLHTAEELAPTQVRTTDLILAGIDLEHAGFLEAFEPKPAPLPPAANEDYESEEEEEEDDDEEPPSKRARGLLVVREKFEQAYAFAVAIGRSEGDAWARSRQIHGNVPANLIADAERELGITFPDEFLAAASAAIPPFAMIGVANAEPHGEPARGFDVAERILEVAENAAAEVPDHLVAIMALPDPNDTTWVCISKGVAWKDRNAQPLFTFTIGADEPDEKGTNFGALLLGLLRETFDDVATDKKPPPEFEPRLI